jgi:hypothetical protein
VNDMKARTWGTGKQPYVIGALIAAVVSVAVIREFFPSTDAPSTMETAQVRSGVLETSEFTIAIPSGYRSVSTAELRKRATKNPPSDALVATLERPGHSVITIARLNPRSSKNQAPRVPTLEDCAGYAKTFAARGNHPVITGATLAEHPPEGLGRACQFTIGFHANQLTHIGTTEWSFSCIHPPGEGAVCGETAAGFRRR